MEAKTTLEIEGKFVKAYPMNIFNSEGVLCATVINEIYIRNLFISEQQTISY
jgi:hypothetical protein